MKSIICLLLTVFLYAQGRAQKPDSLGSKIIESNLKVVNDCINKSESSLQKISDAIVFFTDLTGIASESDGNYYGQFHPTKNDSRAWTNWYHLNKDYLFWDKEIKAFILYKKVKPSIL